MSSEKTRSGHYGTQSIVSLDSTGKQKSFRRILTRFADKTSMTGVTYISNAKFWWAKLIWCIMLVAAMVIMGLHLWYLFDQYYSWPVQTKISLGFDALPFPEVTICNTNIIHSRRLNQYSEAQKLKALLEALRPENIAPNQYDENYNFDDTETTTSQPTQSTLAPDNQNSVPPTNDTNQQNSSQSGTNQNPPPGVSSTFSAVCFDLYFLR